MCSSLTAGLAVVLANLLCSVMGPVTSWTGDSMEDIQVHHLQPSLLPMLFAVPANLVTTPGTCRVNSLG